MVTFEVESDRFLNVSDGTAVPFLKVLFDQVIDVELVNADTGEPIEPLPGERKVVIGDPLERYRLRFNRAPNFVWNIVLGEQQRLDETRDPNDEQFVSIVDSSAFLLNPDGTQKRQLSLGEFLPY